MRLLPGGPSEEVRAATGFWSAVHRHLRVLVFSLVLVVAGGAAVVFAVVMACLLPTWLGLPLAGLLGIAGGSVILLSSLFSITGVCLIVIETIWGPTEFPAGRCQKCGYNLRGNTSGVCPECGTAVQILPGSESPAISSQGTGEG